MGLGGFQMKKKICSGPHANHVGHHRHFRFRNQEIPGYQEAYTKEKNSVGLPFPVCIVKNTFLPGAGALDFDLLF